MKNALIIFSLFLWLPSFAQKETVFKISAIKTISLIPDLDTLIGGRTYFFTLKGINQKEVAGMQLSGGRFAQKDSGMEFTIYSNVDAASFSIRSKNNASSKAIFEKQFYVIRPFEAPVFEAPAVAGRATNTISIFWDDFPPAKFGTITKAQLLSRQQFSAYKLSSPNITYAIGSFKMSVTCGGVTENFSSSNDHLTPEMLKKMTEVSEGCTIVLKEIRFMGTNTSPDTQLAGPFSLYVKN